MFLRIAQALIDAEDILDNQRLGPNERKEMRECIESLYLGVKILTDKLQESHDEIKTLKESHETTIDN